MPGNSALLFVFILMDGERNVCWVLDFSMRPYFGNMNFNNVSQAGYGPSLASLLPLMGVADTGRLIMGNPQNTGLDGFYSSGLSQGASMPPIPQLGSDMGPVIGMLLQYLMAKKERQASFQDQLFQQQNAMMQRMFQTMMLMRLYPQSDGDSDISPASVSGSSRKNSPQRHRSNGVWDAAITSDELAALPNGERMNAKAVAAFKRAQARAAKDGVKIDISQAYRTDQKQQELWNRLHGSQAVAKAGHSTHNLGRGAVGIDIRNWKESRRYLEAEGFIWRNYDNDPYHFDYVGSDTQET